MYPSDSFFDCVQAFEKAMTLRFSMIDVNKSLRISRTKGAEEKLKLVNELKIITAPEEIYNLWSEVISRVAHGELYNPDTGSKFNEKENWKQESCLLSPEYFKWLSNLSLQDLERLAMHLLNQSGEKRKFLYPKVMIKAISFVLESCYSTKEWVERRKRKQLVKAGAEQHRPNPGFDQHRWGAHPRQVEGVQARSKHHERVNERAPGAAWRDLLR